MFSFGSRLFIILVAFLALSIVGPAAAAPFGTPSRSPTITEVGASLTSGSESQTGHAYDYWMTLPTFRGAAFVDTNIGIPSEVTTQMLGFAPANLFPLYHFNSPLNIAVIWEGPENDYGELHQTAAQAFANQVALCQAVRAQGFKVIVATLIDRNMAGYAAFKNSYNALVRANWTWFADGVVDLGAISQIGADGASLDPTYFYAGGTHLVDAGYQLVGTDPTNGVQQAVYALIAKGLPARSKQRRGANDNELRKAS